VAGTIIVNYKFGTLNLGVQIGGVARKLSKLRIDLAMKYFTRREKPAPSKVADILRNGYCWYELKPDFIDLIDEENFAFNKQKI
jgi:uncharacterized protein YhbP (UPF0306 family)